MAVQTATKTLTVEQVLAGAGELAALPQVVMRVLDLTASPGATAADLERALASDPVLAAKIMALANSAYYGLPRRLTSLREAVVFLGFKAIRSLALAITAFAGFLGKSDAASLARRAVWHHSLRAAACARTLVPLLPAPAREGFGVEDAFTGALLHDIGKMALDRSQHALFVSLTQMAHKHSARFHEVEAGVLPFGHALIGAQLAGQWNLPPALCEAIAFHHAPRAATRHPRLAAAVSLANEITHFVDDRPAVSSDALWARAQDAVVPLRLGPERLSVIAAACRAELDKGQPAF